MFPWLALSSKRNTYSKIRYGRSEADVYNTSFKSYLTFHLNTVQDILNDIDIIPVTPSLSGVSFPPGTLVMNGVYSPWKSVHDLVISEVASLIAKFPTYTLESTGHSLGGSLSYLSYIALAQNFPGKSITSNALAAFPIGNSVFAQFGSSQKGLLRRGNNLLDGVPVRYRLCFIPFPSIRNTNP